MIGSGKFYSADFMTFGWLYGNEKKARIVSCAGLPDPETGGFKENSGQEVFDGKGHIADSHCLDLSKVGIVTPGDGNKILLNVINEMNGFGISQDDDIALVDYEGGVFGAPYLWWCLKTAGYQNVRILDGGFFEYNNNVTGAVTFEKTPSQSDKVAIVTGLNLQNRINSQYYILPEEVRLNNREQQIIDMRNHIPKDKAIQGSIHIPFNGLVDGTAHGNKLKPLPALSEMFYERGVDFDKELVVLCDIGFASPLFMLAARGVYAFDRQNDLKEPVVQIGAAKNKEPKTSSLVGGYAAYQDYQAKPTRSL